MLSQCALHQVPPGAGTHGHTHRKSCRRASHWAEHWAQSIFFSHSRPPCNPSVDIRFFFVLLGALDLIIDIDILAQPHTLASFSAPLQERAECEARCPRTTQSAYQACTGQRLCITSAYRPVHLVPSSFYYTLIHSRYLILIWMVHLSYTL